MTKSTWRPSSLAEAKRKATVDITCPSGARFTVRPLPLGDLVAANGMPEDLVRVALIDLTVGVMGEIYDSLRRGDSASLQNAKQMEADTLQLRNRLVLAAVVAPKLSERDLPDLDPFDLNMIAAVAQRRISKDATGKEIGAQALDQFPGAGGE